MFIAVDQNYYPWVYKTQKALKFHLERNEYTVRNWQGDTVSVKEAIKLLKENKVVYCYNSEFNSGNDFEEKIVFVK